MDRILIVVSDCVHDLPPFRENLGDIKTKYSILHYRVISLFRLNNPDNFHILSSNIEFFQIKKNKHFFK